MIRLAHPEYLYALCVIPVLILLFIFMMMWKNRKLAQFGDAPVVSSLFPMASRAKAVSKFLLLLFAVFFLIAAVVNPQIGSTLEKVKRKGVDVIIALDVSNSMKAEDIKPNRLERAKQAIFRMINQLRDDRIGLIVFAGEPYVQLPVTYDYAAAKLFLSSVETDIVPSQGTAIGPAIALAVRSFGPDEKGKHRAIIVITDGENHEDDAIREAQLAASKGVKVYTIGMGSLEGAPVPVFSNELQTGFKRDKEGNVVVSKLNESLLREIAAAGKGVFVRANAGDDGLEIILKEIARMEKKEMESKIFTDYEDRFQFFLLPAFILLVIELLLTGRKSTWLKKIRIFRPLGVCCLLALPATLSFAQSPRQLVREGNKLYEQKKYPDAEISYRKSLEEKKKPHEATFNLGDALYRQEKYDEAAGQFQKTAEEAKDKKLSAKAYHNLGNSLLKQKKYEESIHAYKNALKKNPTDTDTKYNLSYAMQMMRQQQQNKNSQDNKKDQQKDQQKKDENKKQEDKKQEDKKQDSGKEQEKKQEQEKGQSPSPSRSSLSKEQAESMLEALKNEEKNLQKKLSKKQAVKVETEKDW